MKANQGMPSPSVEILAEIQITTLRFHKMVVSPNGYR